MKVSMQKQGSLMGTVGRGITSAITAPLKLVGKGTRAVGGSAANVLMRGAESNPLGFTAAAGMGVPVLASLPNPLKDPDTVAKGYQARQLVASANPGVAMKLSSSVLSEMDLLASLKVQRHFEKTASGFMNSAVQEALAEILQTSVKNAPPASGARRAAGGIPSPSDVAKKVHVSAGDNAMDLERRIQEMQKRLESATSEESGLKLQVLRDQMQFGRQRDIREAAKHEKDMKQWSPKSLALAGLALGGTAAGVGAGTHAISHGVGVIQEKARGLTADKRFQDVVKVQPSLAQHPLAPKYFAILDRASPYMASEPYLAAATIEQMINTPGLSDQSVPAVQPKMLQEILRTEEARQGTRFPFQQKDVNLRDIALLG
jgi:hypothetical protein